MSNVAFQLTHNFVSEVCCNCGIVFAVDQAVNRRWHEKGQSFYCPNGHSQHYIETDVQKLQKELARERQNKEFYQRNAASEREARERTERRLSAANGAKTRLRNRIKHGVCPCCHRTVKQLAAHMKTKHPDFQPDDSADAQR